MHFRIHIDVDSKMYVASFNQMPQLLFILLLVFVRLQSFSYLLTWIQKYAKDGSEVFKCMACAQRRLEASDLDMCKVVISAM